MPGLPSRNVKKESSAVKISCLKNWRKHISILLNGRADGAILLAELHWYEATGIGRRELKIKRYLD